MPFNGPTDNLKGAFVADDVSGADQDPIGTWAKSAGSGGGDFTASGAARPLLQVAPAGFKGHKSLKFDATDDLMTGNALSNYWAAGAKVTGAVVIPASAGAGNEQAICSAANVTSWYTLAMGGHATPDSRNIHVRNNDGATDDLLDSFDILAHGALVVIAYHTGGSIFIEVSHTTVDRSTVSMASGDTSDMSENMVLGGLYAGSRLGFEIAEIAFYNAYVAADKNNLKDYLVSKYLRPAEGLQSLFVA
jgi:hypothetical protein